MKRLVRFAYATTKAAACGLLTSAGFLAWRAIVDYEMEPPRR
jgi:hypothetical protein